MSEEIAVLYRNRKPRYRAARRQALRAQGVKPTNCQVLWYVESIAVPLPSWILSCAVPGLATTKCGIWLRPKDALRLIAFDRYSTGGSITVTKAEFRYCEVCHRPLIGIDAASRRKLLETSATARKLPCSLTCFSDRETKLWSNYA
jgi:hypothetical protein